MEPSKLERIGAYILTQLIYGFVASGTGVIFLFIGENFLSDSILEIVYLLITLIAFIIVYLLFGDIGKRILGIRILNKNGEGCKNYQTLLTTGASLSIMVQLIILIVLTFIMGLEKAFETPLVGYVSIIFIVLFFLGFPFWRIIAKQQLRKI